VRPDPTTTILLSWCGPTQQPPQQTNNTNNTNNTSNPKTKCLDNNGRVSDGFVDLTKEMKIKTLAVIHKLDSDPLVQIKRMVFGK
jgi:hypothetical protein